VRVLFDPSTQEWLADQDQRVRIDDETLEIVDENLELLEVSDRNSNTPIRPYYHVHRRTRDQAAHRNQLSISEEEELLHLQGRREVVFVEQSQRGR
jgi:hypothetical protein